MLTPESLTATRPQRSREERRDEAGLRYRRHVTDLLGRRSDLHGVSGLADMIHDGTLWTV